jgi:hypothetical protein
VPALPVRVHGNRGPGGGLAVPRRTPHLAQIAGPVWQPGQAVSPA